MRRASDARTRRPQRHLVLLATLRVLATSTAVVVAYYLLPLDRLEAAPVAVPVVVGLLILAAVGAWDIRAIVELEHPSIRAVEALSGYVPLFLVLFASVYFLMYGTRSRTQFQRSAPDPYRRAVLHPHRVQHRRVRGHQHDEPNRACRRHDLQDAVLNLVLLGLGLRLLTASCEDGRHPTAR